MNNTKAMGWWAASTACLLAGFLGWNLYWHDEIVAAERNRAIRTIERAGCYVVDDEGYVVSHFGEGR